MKVATAGVKGAIADFVCFHCPLVAPAGAKLLQIIQPSRRTKFPMKPIIFFDWDGTLADSMNLCVAEIRQALITMRLPDLPDDVLRQCNGPTFEQSLDILHIPMTARRST